MVQSEIATMMVLFLTLMWGGVAALLTRWIECEAECVLFGDDLAVGVRVQTGPAQRARIGRQLFRRCSLTTGGGSFDWT